MRNFQEPISMRNLENEVDDNIVKTVIEVTTDNTPLVHRYYNWKTKKMGIPLTLADIYAPLEKEKKNIHLKKLKILCWKHIITLIRSLVNSRFFFTEKLILI